MHPFYTEYIPVMYNKKCYATLSKQKMFDKTKRSVVKLKDEEANVIQA